MKNILICLPTTNQTIKSATAVTIANVVKVLERENIRVELHNIDSAEIVTARDMFANMVLHSDFFDGLLFIDSDMSFDPSIALRMVSLRENVVGAAYVRRSLDFTAFIEAARNSDDLDVARRAGSSFTVLESWGAHSSRQTKSGFTAMAAVGMGCALISRTALKLMVDAGVVGPRPDLSTGDGRSCYSFFEPISDASQRLGEDYSFCYRWTKLMEEKLWVCTDSRILHIGSFEYSARYL